MIKIFSFNDFQVNTYLVFDETKECIIVDPACYSEQEKNELVDYISENGLKPVKIINTHTHIDHVLGNSFVSEKYKIGIYIHKAGEVFVQNMKSSGALYGFEIKEVFVAAAYLEDKEIVEFGNSQLEILYTPGHADGSICLLSHQQKMVITGDLLFAGSIGRTDLPTGDYNVLIEAVSKAIFTLPEDYIVYPGHGSNSTVGNEKNNNPFFK